MLIRNEDGIYQIVRRSNGTVYIRKFAPSSTEAQRVVRAKLAIAAINSFGMPREKVIENVARSVKPVIDKKYLNLTEEELAEKYPEVYSIVAKRTPVKASRTINISVKESESENEKS